MHTSTANAKLNAAVIAKLHAEGLTIDSPWCEIEACLAQVVSPTACIRAAREMHQIAKEQPMEPMYDLSDYPDDTPPECENCASTIGVTYGPNPYALEINDDDSCHWLCKNCIQKSADSIQP